MTDSLIALLALGFIILVVVLLFAMARRTGRHIEEAGFASIEYTPPEIEGLVGRLLEASISAVYQKQLEDESAWLVSLRPEGTDDPGRELLVFTLEKAHLPEVAAFHSRVKLPRFMRRPSGGVLARLEPATGPVWAFGGATQSNALANAASWVRVLAFLGESLKPGDKRVGWS